MTFFLDSCKECEITLYHGSDKIVDKPCFGFHNPNNDYSCGFYTTRIKKRADAWALANGNNQAYTCKYTISLDSLNVLDLDDYGPLAWVAGIIYNRVVSSELAEYFKEDFINNYKVNTTDADVIIGYRADDNYNTVINFLWKAE